MSLILFSQLMIGNVFVIRILRKFRERSLVSEDSLTKIGTLTLTIISSIGFFPPSRLSFSFSLVAICISAMLLALFSLQRRQIDALKSNFPLFLDRWILNAKLGSSISSARERALIEESVVSQRLLRAFFNSTRAECEKHAFLDDHVALELKEIGAQTHQAIARLENLRLHLRRTSDFRRKSGQALLQSRIQMITIGVLVLALQVYDVRRYGWSRVGDFILLSLALSAIGIVVMNILASKRRWRI